MLTLSKLMETVSEYHNKETLVLIPGGQVNNNPQQGGKCWRCGKVGHYAKDCHRSRNCKCGKCGKLGHFEVCCHTKRCKGRTPSRSSSRGRGNTRRKINKGEKRGNLHNKHYDKMAGDHASGDDFYVRSFLRSVQFFAKFIPNFTTITSRSWDLNAKWQWDPKKDEAFREIKDPLTRAPLVAYRQRSL